MLNTDIKDSYCPNCESSLRKIILSQVAFCPQCFCKFSSTIKELLPITDLKTPNPTSMNRALKNENYELAEKLKSEQSIPEQEHPFLFINIEFHRNLESQQFLNIENSKHHSRILKELKNTHQELSTLNNVNPSLIYIDVTEYIRTLHKHHISYGLINTDNKTKTIEDFRAKIYSRPIDTNFSFHDDFGFLGSDLLQLGHAFSIKAGIALPHLYFDSQIPRIAKACNDLGFSLSPLQVNKHKPLIYTIESISSTSSSLKDTIKDLIALGSEILNAETQAQLSSLQSSDMTCYKHFSSRYWSLGSLPSIDKQEFYHYLEDIFCAQTFHYLDTGSPERITEQLNKELPTLLHTTPSSANKETKDIPLDTFEEFLNNIRG
ncbi:hypothetical protein PQO01_17835 [Lentisphaera marina]|uniref:hypothetical protein n=1 Tax=Lentisphaera marina TaxID=1111041 RepID=UPI002365AE4A|nr:hypothetical protein [Lentisphaera marina]MDD7986815.1 hypothetical protein [Lentisphaera marina]